MSTGRPTFSPVVRKVPVGGEKRFKIRADLAEKSPLTPQVAPSTIPRLRMGL